ncbi:hypothetical protein [Leptobacterium sp. I13]|uniref:hypothetical protein n=1 Tax=Leptobacterium meishanense TaxID=3128904 RepID=UPI0030ED81CA
MKRIITISLFLFFTYAYTQKVVTVGNSTTNYITIASVENSQQWTEVGLKFNPTTTINATLHAPSGKSPFVLTDKKGNRYSLIFQTGWGGSDKGGFGSMSLTANQEKRIKLYFSKLNNIDDIYSMTEVNCEGSGCWNFYNIKLTEAVISGGGDSSSGSFTNSKVASATYKNAWLDKGVYENGKYGIRVHVSFSVENMTNKRGQITVRFMDEDDEFLSTTNSSFANKNGDIAVFKSIYPSSDNANYSDIEVFMPYDELNLPVGTHNLKCDIDLIDDKGNLVKHFALKDFTYYKF